LSPPTEDSLPAAGREGTGVEIEERAKVQIRTSELDPCPLRFLRPLRAPRVTLFESELEPVPPDRLKKWGKSTAEPRLTHPGPRFYRRRTRFPISQETD
jgi:hypothetical protein